MGKVCRAAYGVGSQLGLASFQFSVQQDALGYDALRDAQKQLAVLSEAGALRDETLSARIEAEGPRANEAVIEVRSEYQVAIDAWSGNAGRAYRLGLLTGIAEGQCTSPAWAAAKLIVQDTVKQMCDLLPQIHVSRGDPLDDELLLEVQAQLERSDGAAAAHDSLQNFRGQTLQPMQSAPDRLFDNMIPFLGQDGGSFLVSVAGGAVKEGGEPCILFDTGSVQTTLLKSCLSEGYKILRPNTVDGWGKAADLVEGELALLSEDGNIRYSVENFQFYVTEDPSATLIMGGFPVEGSFPWELAKKYAESDLGFGIASGSGRSFLFLGADTSVVDDKMQWRTDVPSWPSGRSFSPDAVPGFTVQFTFRGIDEPIQVPDVMATIDTGAPPMALRLNSSDPHLSTPFLDCFVPDRYWATTDMDGADKSAKMISSESDCTVTVEFEDSSRERSGYSFKARVAAEGGDPRTYAVSVGTWTGEVPWPYGLPDKPRNRINLGNSIYEHCPVFFYDIKGMRVGFKFDQTAPAPRIALSVDSFSLGRGWMVSQGDYQCGIQDDGNVAVLKNGMFQTGSYQLLDGMRPEKIDFDAVGSMTWKDPAGAALKVFSGSPGTGPFSFAVDEEDSVRSLVVVDSTGRSLYSVFSF